MRRVQAELDLEETLLLRRVEVEAPADGSELPNHAPSQPSCRHLVEAPLVVEPRTVGCEGCEAEGRDDWVHLRTCLSCGHTGCCDSAPPARRRHFQHTEHPVIRPAEPGESWRWCYVDREVG